MSEQQDAAKNITDPVQMEDHGEMKSDFLRVYSHKIFPHIVLQHTEKNEEGEKVDYEFKFVNGVIRFTDSETHARFERCMKALHPSVSRHILPQGDLLAAEQIAREHQARVNRERQAVAGPFQSSHVQSQTPEQMEQRLQTEAAARGATITPGTLRNLLKQPANALEKKG